MHTAPSHASCGGTTSIAHHSRSPEGACTKPTQLNPPQTTNPQYTSVIAAAFMPHRFATW